MAAIVNTKPINIIMKATSGESEGYITFSVSGNLTRDSKGKLYPSLSASLDYLPGTVNGTQIYPSGSWAVDIEVEATINGYTSTIATYSTTIYPSSTSNTRFNYGLKNESLLDIGFNNSSIELSAICRINPSAEVTRDIQFFYEIYGSLTTGMTHGYYDAFACTTESGTVYYDEWIVPIKLYKTNISDFIDISNKMKVRTGSAFKSIILHPNQILRK